MKPRSLVLTIASVALLAACSQAPAPAPDTSAADAATVRGLTDTFVTAWNAGDVAAFSALIAEDVIEMPQGTVANIGHEAVVAAMSSGYDIKAVQQSATVDEVVVMGDYANAWGSWRLDAVEATDPPAEATTGKWMALYRRNAEGGWQIWRWMWNQTSGPPLPAA